MRSKKLLPSASPVRSSGKRYSLSVVARGLLPPAPFIRISIFPKAAMTASQAAKILSFSSTLHTNACAVPPFAQMRFATTSAASSERSSTATFAPHSPRASAKQEQRTPPPPVTTAVLPERSTLKGTDIIFRPRFRVCQAFHGGNQQPSLCLQQDHRRPHVQW